MASVPFLAAAAALLAAATLPAGAASQTISAQAFLDVACNAPPPVGSVTLTDGSAGTFPSTCAITMSAGEDLDWGARVRVTLPPNATMTVATPGVSTEAEILVGPDTSLSAGAIEWSTSADIIVDAGATVASTGAGGVKLVTPTTLRLGGTISAGGGGGGVSATAGREILLGPSGSITGDGDVELIATGGLALQAADVTAAATTAVSSTAGMVALISTSGNVDVGSGVTVTGGGGVSISAEVEARLAQTPSSSMFSTTLTAGDGGNVSVGGGEKTTIEEGVVATSAGTLTLGAQGGGGSGEVLVKSRARLTAAGALTLAGGKCTVEPGATTEGNPVTVC